MNDIYMLRGCEGRRVLRLDWMLDWIWMCVLYMDYILVHDLHIKGLQRDKMAALSTNYRVSISSSSLWLWSYGKAAFAVSLSSSTQQRPRITTTLAAHKPYKVHGISLLSSLLLYLAVVLQGTRHLSTYGIGYELTGYLTVSTVQTFSSLTYLNLLKLVLSYKQGIY